MLLWGVQYNLCFNTYCLLCNFRLDPISSLLLVTNFPFLYAPSNFVYIFTVSYFLKFLFDSSSCWLHARGILWHSSNDFTPRHAYNCNVSVIKTRVSGDGSLPHAGPLRLLELVTQPQSWASLPCPAPQAAEHIFAILTPLIKKGSGDTLNA